MARAHAQAVRAVREECVRANDRIEGRVSSRLRLAGEGTQKAQAAAVAGGSAAVTAGGLVLGAIMLPAVVAGGVGVVGYRRHQARRSAARLQELTAFVSEIEAAARELGTAALPRHELRMDETDAGIPRYGYVPVDTSPWT
jgi:Flp pilus assembly protein TadB